VRWNLKEAQGKVLVRFIAKEKLKERIKLKSTSPIAIAN